MLIDTSLSSRLTTAADNAAAAEAAGYDGLWTAETSHDPFLPHALAAPATNTITLGTSIAVAFARNPMVLANLGYDLTSLSNGRFVLGLGSQIKPHITKRFSMEWSKPAARMREMVQAIHAIWDCWENDTKLDFQGDFYTHTIMTPFFNPGPNPAGRARIFVSAVGPLMTQVVGEVCDGLFAHPFTTPEFLNDVTIPNLQAGRQKSGRSGEGFEISLSAFIVTGATEEEMEASAKATRKQIAFYGSTPAYRAVLDHHGWGELQTELNAMSKQGQWDAMGDVIDDDVLGAFATVGEPDTIADSLLARYGQNVQRLSFYTPGTPADAPQTIQLIEDIKART